MINTSEITGEVTNFREIAQEIGVEIQKKESKKLKMFQRLLD